MIRFKFIENIISLPNRSNHRSKLGNEQRLFIENRLLKTATCFRSTSSISFIISIHYLMLICVMIASVISVKISSSRPNLIVQDHLRFRRSIQHKLTTHNLNKLNSQSFPLTKVLNNQKLLSLSAFTSSSSKAIRSVHTVQRTNLSSELNTDLFKDSTTIQSGRSEFSLDLLSDFSGQNKRTNNQNRRSLNEIKEEVLANLSVESQQHTKATLSPLLPKFSTYRPILFLNENQTEQQLPRNSNSSTTHQLVKTEQYSIAVKITISTMLSLLIIVTTVGNVFVIAAICLDKNLQSAQNYLVLSLAVADLTVALLVMPPCMVYGNY